MEGETLVEKLANAPRSETTRPAEDDGGIDGSQPIDTPADVAETISHPSDTSETDAIVRAAKAMRDAAPDVVVEAALQTCLIVDDSRVIRKVSSKIAKSLGYAVVEAQDGIEALARCKQAMPALVLTDWNMPEMDGIEFVRQLRAIPTDNAPTVVFCTSKGAVEDIHEGVKAGADDYIVKPFDEAALRAKLEKLAKG